MAAYVTAEHVFCDKLYVTRVFANRVMYHATRECRCCLSLYSV